MSQLKFGPFLSLFDFSKIYSESPEKFFGSTIKLQSSVDKVRSADAGRLVFIDLVDGTTVLPIRGIASQETYKGQEFKSEFEPLGDEVHFKVLSFEQLKDAASLSPYCSVAVEGEFVKSPETATQKYEFKILKLSVIGGIPDPSDPPMTKSLEKKITSLRQKPFDRWFSQASKCLFRIGSTATLEVEKYLHSAGFHRTDGNILTSSDCEGAGETFKVTPQMFSKDELGQDIPVGLTVSSQLPLEKFIDGLRRTFVFQKSFRAEKSDTNKHLCEFRHLEIEAKYIDLNWLLDFTEGFLKHSISSVYEKCSEEFDFLESKLGPDDIRHVRAFFLELVKRPFIRIKHRDAVDLIRKLVTEKTMLPDEKGKLSKVKVSVLPTYDGDLGSEHEKILVTYHGFLAYSEEERTERLAKGLDFGSFVFVTHWPFPIKSFYMKQLGDGTCESFDLLAPYVGELFGGSMREWRYEFLEKAIADRKMDIRPIQWYLDLRKKGAAPHGGWGMGFDRFLMMITGVPSVRDIVPLPVYYTHCPY
jgi:asparaginyl-tRNA synthetase